MTTETRHDDVSWEHIGEAAQHFARRVARDASRFAERLEEHTSEFAREMSHEWRSARRRYRRAGRGAEADVRRVFDDVRTVLSDILDGVDEFIERLFEQRGNAAETETHHAERSEALWTRMVSNRVMTCAGCGRMAEPGEEVFAFHAPEGITVRCLDCGVPDAVPPAS